jgi:anti-anti-sigma factor
VRAIDEAGEALVLDLSDVAYIDSVGLGTLVSGLKRANEHGTKLRLVCADSQTHKVLTITGLIQVFDVYPDRSSAVAGAGNAE